MRTRSNYGPGLIWAVGTLTLGALAVLVYIVTDAPGWLNIVLAAVALGLGGEGLYSLVRWLRVDPGERQYRRTVRSLWTMTRRIPAETYFTDPETGTLFGRTRRGLFVMLMAVAAPGPGAEPEDVFMTLYVVGTDITPAMSPIQGALGPVVKGDAPPPDRSSRYRAVQMAAETGVMNVEPAQLQDISQQLSRALDAANT